MTRYKIPETGRTAIAALMRLSPDQIAQIVAALRQCKPSLNSDAFVDCIALSSDSLALSKEEARRLVGMLLALYGLRENDGLSAEEMAAEVADAARQSNDERLVEPKDGWKNFEGTLSALLSIDDVLGLSAKGIDLQSENERHLAGVRVLTDARPIFSANPSEGPKGFVITHTLEINVHEDGDDQSWFISLTTENLEELTTAAQRALTKSLSLEKALEVLAVPILKLDEMGDDNDV